MHDNQTTSKHKVNKPQRRNFLKAVTLGAGVFIAGTVLSKFEYFSKSFKNMTDGDLFSKQISQNQGMNFLVAEDNNEITFSNKEGLPLLIIEK